MELPVRLTAGMTELTTAMTAMTVAMVRRAVAMAFSMAALPYIPLGGRLCVTEGRVDLLPAPSGGTAPSHERQLVGILPPQDGFQLA